MRIAPSGRAAVVLCVLLLLCVPAIDGRMRVVQVKEVSAGDTIDVYHDYGLRGDNADGLGAGDIGAVVGNNTDPCGSGIANIRRTNSLVLSLYDEHTLRLQVGVVLTNGTGFPVEAELRAGTNPDMGTHLITNVLNFTTYPTVYATPGDYAVDVTLPRVSEEDDYVLQVKMRAGDEWFYQCLDLQFKKSPKEGLATGFWQEGGESVVGYIPDPAENGGSHCYRSYFTESQRSLTNGFTKLLGERQCMQVSVNTTQRNVWTVQAVREFYTNLQCGGKNRWARLEFTYEVTDLGFSPKYGATRNTSVLQWDPLSVSVTAYSPEFRAYALVNCFCLLTVGLEAQNSRTVDLSHPSPCVASCSLLENSDTFNPSGPQHRFYTTWNVYPNATTTGSFPYPHFQVSNFTFDNRSTVPLLPHPTQIGSVSALSRQFVVLRRYLNVTQPASPAEQYANCTEWIMNTWPTTETTTTDGGDEFLQQLEEIMPIYAWIAIIGGTFLMIICCLCCCMRNADMDFKDEKLAAEENWDTFETNELHLRIRLFEMHLWSLNQRHRRWKKKVEEEMQSFEAKMDGYSDEDEDLDVLDSSQDREVRARRLEYLMDDKRPDFRLADVPVTKSLEREYRVMYSKDVTVTDQKIVKFPLAAAQRRAVRARKYLLALLIVCVCVLACCFILKFTVSSFGMTDSYGDVESLPRECFYVTTVASVAVALGLAIIRKYVRWTTTGARGVSNKIFPDDYDGMSNGFQAKTVAGMLNQQRENTAFLYQRFRFGPGMGADSLLLLLVFVVQVLGGIIAYFGCIAFDQAWGRDMGYTGDSDTPLVEDGSGSKLTFYVCSVCFVIVLTVIALLLGVYGSVTGVRAGLLKLYEDVLTRKSRQEDVVDLDAQMLQRRIVAEHGTGDPTPNDTREPSRHMHMEGDNDYKHAQQQHGYTGTQVQSPTASSGGLPPSYSAACGDELLQSLEERDMTYHPMH